MDDFRNTLKEQKEDLFDRRKSLKGKVVKRATFTKDDQRFSQRNVSKIVEKGLEAQNDMCEIVKVRYFDIRQRSLLMQS